MSVPNVSFEVVKLLLQVAWADHDVAEAEADAILGFARRQGLSENELAQVEAALRRGAPLPVPNLGALKPHKARVLGELKELLQSDLHISDEEESILRQVSALL
jgi:uncharacterized tellurite resistance protein B-like protein